MCFASQLKPRSIDGDIAKFRPQDMSPLRTLRRKSLSTGDMRQAREWETLDRLVGAIWRFSSPGGLFHNAYVGYHYQGSLSWSETIAITNIASDAETLARDAEFLAWLRPRLAVHEGFIALRHHWAAMGVSGKYSGHDGYGGDATNWSIAVPLESLPLLEERAQDAVGLTTDAEREGAAREFRIYMARNYAKDWEENRKTMPPIDQSPYAKRIESQ